MCFYLLSWSMRMIIASGGYVSITDEVLHWIFALELTSFESCSDAGVYFYVCIPVDKYNALYILWAISSCYMKSTKPEATLLTIRNKSLLSISLTHRIFAELLCALCICLYVYPFVRPSVCPMVRLSTPLPLSLSNSLSVPLSPFLLLSLCLSVCLSLSPLQALINSSQSIMGPPQELLG